MKWVKGTAPFKSSRPEVLCKKKMFLKNFTKITGKYLCQSLFLIQLQDKICNFVKKETLTPRCFPVNFVKFLRTPCYRTPLVAASEL